MTSAITLIGATLTMGLAAGVFALFAHTIMPGLHSADDRTFVDAFQHLDRAIVNPWFMVTAFLGALVCTAAAALANRGTAAMSWIIAALVLYLAAVVITIAVHLPLNDTLKAAGDPGRIDVTLARRHHHVRVRPPRLGARPLRPHDGLVRLRRRTVVTCGACLGGV